VTEIVALATEAAEIFSTGKRNTIKAEIIDKHRNIDKKRHEIDSFPVIQS
jgi:hypothetical protein